MPGRLTEFVVKRRNALLFALLFTTLCVSGMANRLRLEASPATVDIPVVAAAKAEESALEVFRRERDEDTLRSMSALEALVGQENLEKSTREAAAAQLQEIVAARQAQTAIEGALVNSSLSPCAAVVSGGCVTIVTEKTSVTEQDTALVLTLAFAHADSTNVRIITAE